MLASVFNRADEQRRTAQCTVALFGAVGAEECPLVDWAPEVPGVTRHAPQSEVKSLAVACCSVTHGTHGLAGRGTRPPPTEHDSVACSAWGGEDASVAGSV